MKLIRYIIVCLVLTASTTVLAQTKSAKRGLCVDNGKITETDLLSLSSGVSWFYNWSTSTSTNYTTSEIMYVPMVWNGGYNKNNLRTFLTNHSDVKYLLAFNEPNFRNQANMTPSQVAAAWPALEEIAKEFNLKLVSPAPNWCGNCVSENGTTYNDPYKYLEDFFAACPDCQVDYVAVHFYMGTKDAIQGSLERLYEKFHKPIWFTEFNMDKNGMGDNGTIDEQRSFMVEAIDYLEQAPYIFRYSWFLARGGIIADLLSSTYGTLSDLGKIYTHMSSYDSNFYHATNKRIEAEHYIKMNNISLVTSTDADGNISVGYTETGSAVTYNINVLDAGLYNLNLRTAAEQVSVIEVYVNNKKLTEITVPATRGWTTWQTTQYPIRLSAGQQQIQLVFKSGNCDFNWISIGDVRSGLNITECDEINIFPNPVQNILSVKSPYLSGKAIIYNLQGKTLLEKQLTEGIQTIDIENLPESTYLLRFFSEKGEHTAKLFTKTK